MLRRARSWYWDMAGFVNKDYSQQVADIAALNAGSGYAGLTGWHLADGTEIGVLQSQLAPYTTALPFNPTAILTDSLLWRGRTADTHPDPGKHWVYYEQYYGAMGLWAAGWHGFADGAADAQYSAWVVTNSVVPVPGAALLGVIGLGAAGDWLRRRRML